MNTSDQNDTKREYTSPELVAFGSAIELTRTGPSGPPESGSPTPRKKL